MSMAKPGKLPRGINRQPEGTYRARIFIDGKQHSLGCFQTIGDAKAALAIARADKARGTFVSPSERRKKLKASAAQSKVQEQADARTIRQMVEAWQDWQEKRGLKLGSRYTYERRLEAHFMPQFGDRSISSVTPDELADWIDALESKLGAKGAAPIHLTVASLFKWATGDAPDLPRGFTPWLLASPVPPLAGVRLRRNAAAKPVERNRTPATAEDIAALAEGMPEGERLAVLLAGWCGLRLGEVLGLRRRHITTTGKGEKVVTWISVEVQVQARGSGLREETPKSAAGVRTVPVPPVIVQALTEHLKDHAATGRDGLLFHRPGAPSKHLHPNTLRTHFNAALDAVNASRGDDDDREPLENFTFHGLRHTALTRLGQAGATTAELKAYAGHSDGKSVERYQHAERERLAALAGALTMTEGD